MPDQELPLNLQAALVFLHDLPDPDGLGGVVLPEELDLLGGLLTEGLGKGTMLDDVPVRVQVAEHGPIPGEHTVGRALFNLDGGTQWRLETVKLRVLTD